MRGAWGERGFFTFGDDLCRDSQALRHVRPDAQVAPQHPALYLRLYFVVDFTKHGPLCPQRITV